jgi:hypothetical protein
VPDGKIIEVEIGSVQFVAPKFVVTVVVLQLQRVIQSWAVPGLADTIWSPQEQRFHLSVVVVCKWWRLASLPRLSIVFRANAFSVC